VGLGIRVWSGHSVRLSTLSWLIPALVAFAVGDWTILHFRPFPFTEMLDFLQQGWVMEIMAARYGLCGLLAFLAIWSQRRRRRLGQ